jgi:ribosomal protein S18 acetylase RimI-like enzyme
VGRVTSLFAELTLREARLDDPDAMMLIDEVQEFYVGLYGGPDTTPIDPLEMSRPDGAFFVGYLDERAIVMGGWRFAGEPIDIPARRPAELKRMYVVPAYRGRGLARDLLRHVEDSAREAGADAMVLETGGPQVAAVGLYRATGYTDIPRFGHYKNEADAVHLGKLF